MEKENCLSAVAYDFQLCTSHEREIWDSAFNYIDQITQHRHKFFILLMYEQSINHFFLNRKTGLDVMQSYPLHRTRFSQYQASSAAHDCSVSFGQCNSGGSTVLDFFFHNL